MAHNFFPSLTKINTIMAQPTPPMAPFGGHINKAALLIMVPEDRVIAVRRAQTPGDVIATIEYASGGMDLKGYQEGISGLAALRAQFEPFSKKSSSATYAIRAFFQNNPRRFDSAPRF